MTEVINQPIIPKLPGVSLPTVVRPPTPSFPVKIPQVKKPSTIKIPSPTPVVEINPVIDASTYVQIIDNNLENELNNLGYVIINKIIVKSNNNHQEIKFLKAINKRCQKVFIYVDVAGYASNNNNIIIIENNNNLLPYSIKNGTHNCIGVEVSGVFFEYGDNSLCTIMKGENDLKFKETNYAFHTESDKHDTIFKGCFVTYPIIKLSELRAHPDIMLDNTNKVIRRLRNSEDSYERKELTKTHHSLEKLNNTFDVFNQACNNSTGNLVSSLRQLEEMNLFYINNPPQTEEEREKYQKVRENLIRANDNIVKLICVMKKAAAEQKNLEKINTDIENITCYLNKEFVDLCL